MIPGRLDKFGKFSGFLRNYIPLNVKEIPMRAPISLKSRASDAETNGQSIA